MPRQTPAQPGGRLVEEQHRGVADQARRQVEAPAHAARVGLDRPRPGLSEVELLEQIVRAPPGRPPGQPDDPADGGSLAGHIVAEHARLTAIRSQQRGEHPTAVVLPAPFGPSSP
jgi:hypothetical protein